MGLSSGLLGRSFPIVMSDLQDLSSVHRSLQTLGGFATLIKLLANYYLSLLKSMPKARGKDLFIHTNPFLLQLQLGAALDIQGFNHD